MEINDDFLQIIAGDVEKLLMESKDSIGASYLKMGEVKVTLAITMSAAGDGVIVVNYDLGHDLEPKPDPSPRIKVKFKRRVSDDQPLLDIKLG